MWFRVADSLDSVADSLDFGGRLEGFGTCLEISAASIHLAHSGEVVGERVL